MRTILNASRHGGAVKRSKSKGKEKGKQAGREREAQSRTRKERREGDSRIRVNENAALHERLGVFKYMPGLVDRICNKFSVVFWGL